MVRQLYMRQALQEVFDQPGINKAIYRGYAIPTSGPVPNAPPGNQWQPPIQRENNGQGPYPFNIAKAKSLLTSHGWANVGRRDDLPGPGQVRHRHHEGPAG